MRPDPRGAGLCMCVGGGDELGLGLGVSCVVVGACVRSVWYRVLKGCLCACHRYGVRMSRRWVWSPGWCLSVHGMRPGSCEVSPCAGVCMWCAHCSVYREGSTRDPCLWGPMDVQGLL